MALSEATKQAISAHVSVGAHVLAAGEWPFLMQRWVRQGDVGAHAHEFWEIVLICGGRGHHFSESGSRALQPGDVFILQPRAWHGYRDCRGLVVYNCMMGRPLLENQLGFLRRDPVTAHLLWSGPTADNGVMRLHLEPEAMAGARRVMEEMLELQLNVDDQLRWMGRMLELLALLRQSGAADKERGLRHRAVAQALQFLEGNPAHSWTLTELAERVNLHPIYFARLFQREMGSAPLGYLARLRTERAATLLLTTALPIAKVGLQLGWRDPSHFAAVFKAQYGQTPAQFRKRQRSAGDGR